MHPQIHGIFDGLAILILVFSAHYRLRWHPAYKLSLLLDGLTTVIWVGALTAWLPNLLIPLRSLFLGETIPINWWRSGLDNWLLAVAGAAFAGYLFLRRRKLPVWLVLDTFAPLLGITLAIWRIGCAINADSYGKITDSWVAMWLPDINGIYAWRYPTQYISIGMNLLIAGILLWFERDSSNRWRNSKGWAFHGFLFWMYVFLYCFQRFFFEFWRGDKASLFGAFTIIHIYCMIGMICGVIGLWFRKKAQRLLVS